MFYDIKDRINHYSFNNCDFLQDDKLENHILQKIKTKYFKINDIDLDLNTILIRALKNKD
jgi:hypothetical protein